MDDPFSNISDKINTRQYEELLLKTDEYPLIGRSKAMDRLRHQVFFASNVRYPIFVTGESGTEKRTVAHKIHEQRNLPDEKFIFVPSNIHDVKAYKPFLEKCIQLSRGGTLYLSEVDNLSPETKDHLMSVILEGKLDLSHGIAKTHLIISCTNPLVSDGEQQFIAKLFGCSIPHLEINIPPLRDRKEDLFDQISHILDKVSDSNVPRIGFEAMKLFLEYNWPENIAELQRVICKLASCGIHDVESNHLYEIGLIERPKQAVDVTVAIFEKDFTSLESTHPSLLKAIKYMAENYREPMTLDSLSQVCFVSTSHLSYLFRRHLKQSFKSVLVALRVFHAKSLIDNSPQLMITDVCLQSGFGDLSHFEKMFKRHIGCSPREYRRELRLKKNIYAQPQ